MAGGKGAEAPIERDALVERLAGLIGAARRIVAIIGPPGAGKSTLVDWLHDRLEERAPGGCAILGMDGFHLDDRLLEARGWRPRKGAPHTFDVAGLAAMLDRLKRDAEDEILAPVFDRDIEIARAGAQSIPRSARLILVEGNYLLFDEAPWSGLRDRFDLSVRIDISEAVLRERLTTRWLGYGLSGQALHEKLEANDLPNARAVIAKSAKADLLLVERRAPEPLSAEQPA